MISIAFKRISKDESIIIRGIAILMMIYLHCFNYYPQERISDVALLGNNLSYWLTKTAGLCVPLYCFLSGYGLYVKFPYQYSYCFSKTASLVKYHWLFLLVFISIGHFFFGAYELNCENLLSNFIGYDTTYNPTLWFLLPYIIIFLISPYLLLCYKQFKIRTTTIFVFIFFVSSAVILKYHAMQIIQIPDGIKVLLECFRLLFYFFIGASFARFGVPMIKLQGGNWTIGMLLLILCFVRGVFDNAIFSPFFCILYLILIANFRYGNKISTFLKTMGSHSLNLWLIHAYFTYGFLDFMIYWTDCPIIIFLSAIILSYLISIAFNYFIKLLRIG